MNATTPARRPRGIRNHNPGNLRLSRDRWQGLAKEQTDEAFFQFESPVYGIRALARTLITYQDRRLAADGSKIDTLREIIARWAPARENDTAAYVAAVARRTGFGADEPLDLHRYEHLRPLVEAIIHHENGQQPYTDAQLDKALVLCGIEPPARPLAKTRTMRAAKAAGLGTVLTAATEVLEPVKEQIAWLAPYSDYARWLALVVIVVGIAGMIWARIDDRARALR